MRKYYQAIFLSNGINDNGKIIKLEENMDAAHDFVMAAGQALEGLIKTDTQLPFGVAGVWLEEGKTNITGHDIKHYRD